ncbi:MAG: GIY-YIG nuclease family protein [Candidatus Micrarchaeota archaeon]
MKKFFVYLLECRDKSYYCGYTNNLPKRVAMHNTGTGGHYTKSHRPAKLVYFKAFSTQKKAMQAERRIKTYSRKQKTALIQKVKK